MKTFLSALLVLVLTVSAGLAGDERDGMWWRQQTQWTRVVYVLGVMDGLSSGTFVASASGGGVVGEYSARTSVLLGHARAGQLTEGLDLFYRDFRNRSIMVGNALCIVAAQIGGMPDREAQKWIEAFRRSAHENGIVQPEPPVTSPKQRPD